MHRAYVHFFQGNWDLAEHDAQLVCTGLVKIDVGCVADAWYQLGELQRIRGHLGAAAGAYSKTRELGNDPQPGFALYLLALGRPAEALKSIQAALATQEAGQPERVKFLSAQIDIALECGELGTAAAAANEIDEIASRFASSGLTAMSRKARGMAMLAQGDAGGALPALRDALQRWQALDAAFEASRVRVVLARAYQHLGDVRAAERELDAAIPVFTRLGAVPDIRTADRLRSATTPSHPITEREIQVLVLVAAGKTNREIGGELFISPRTVSRHLENIYAKLSLSSRSAATAWCMEHGLRESDRG